MPKMRTLKIDMKWTVCILTILVICVTSDKEELACSNLQYEYSSRGLDGKDIPAQPISGSDLRICSAMEGRTCCTQRMEKVLSEQSKADFKKALTEATSFLADTFRTRAEKFDSFFRSLLTISKRDFHDMFKKTYGVLYEQNAYVFTDLFDSLESYFNRGKVKLDDALDSFFNTLYQKMFTVLNAQYRFDEKYLECVSEYMKELQPFGDVPKKLSVQLKRSFVATRALAQALVIGRDVVSRALEVGPSSQCWKEVTRMTSCPACRGFLGLKPCNSYCVHVMSGCLSLHAQLNDVWNNFTDAMISVCDRLVGPFNIEVVVEPIHIKISEAIMNFQENGQEVSQKVFQGCGKPRLGKREAPPFGEVPIGRNKGSGGGEESMEKLIRDIKQKVRLTRNTWGRLPYQLCNNEKVAASPLKEDDCWNGQDKARFEGTSTTDYSTVPHGNSVMNEQVFALRLMTTRLKAAYNGVDVEWVDEEDAFGSGSGGGRGVVSSQDGTSEEVDIGSGSGMGPIDRDDNPRINYPDRGRDNFDEKDQDIGFPQAPKENIPTNNNNNNINNNEDANTSAGVPSPNMSLEKAIVASIVPVAVAWFGSLFNISI